jgi:hypothetical protein
MTEISGSTLAAGATAANCSKSITVTLAGSPSGWYTDVIKTASSALSTDSDGYKITVLSATIGGVVIDATNVYQGGCIVTTGNYVCIEAVQGAGFLGLMKVYALTAAKFSAAARVNTGTEITIAKW